MIVIGRFNNTVLVIGTSILLVSAVHGVTHGAQPAEPTPSESTESQATATTAQKPLDLRAPDITELYSDEEIKRFLSRTLDPGIEEIEVEDARSHEAPPASPAVWGGIAAPIWALLHPTQAWRIIAPIPPDRAKHIGNERPDATNPNLRVLPPAVAGP